MSTFIHELELRRLRGQQPSLAHFMHYLGPGRQEEAPHPVIRAAREPDTQLRVATEWLSGHLDHQTPGHELGTDDQAVFALACTALCLIRAAGSQMDHELKMDGHLSRILEQLNSTHVPLPRFLEAVSHLALPETTVNALLVLTRLLPPGPCPEPGTPERGWWHLRLQNYLICSPPGLTELTWLTTSHEGPELNLMLGAWDTLMGRFGRFHPSSMAWTPVRERLNDLDDTERHALIRQAQMIVEALDDLNPTLARTRPPQTQSDLIQTLIRLRVPRRDRVSGASAALLSLWIMTRIPEHWTQFFPKENLISRNLRQPERTLMAFLCAEHAPWNDAIWRMSQALEDI